MMKTNGTKLLTEGIGDTNIEYLELKYNNRIRKDICDSLERVGWTIELYLIAPICCKYLFKRQPIL